jgi:hypothetical protein
MTLWLLTLPQRGSLCRSCCQNGSDRTCTFVLLPCAWHAFLPIPFDRPVRVRSLQQRPIPTTFQAAYRDPHALNVSRVISHDITKGIKLKYQAGFGQHRGFERGKPTGMIIHPTSGGGGVQGVVNTLHERGLSVQYRRMGGKCDTLFGSLRDSPAQSRPVRLSRATRSTSFKTGINHLLEGQCAL